MILQHVALLGLVVMAASFVSGFIRAWWNDPERRTQFGPATQVEDGRKRRVFSVYQRGLKFSYEKKGNVTRKTWDGGKPYISIPLSRWRQT